MINEQLLDMLRCPLNPRKTRLIADGNGVLCEQCHLRFKSKEGILSLVAEEAELPPGCESLSDLPCQKERSG